MSSSITKWFVFSTEMDIVLYCCRLGSGLMDLVKLNRALSAILRFFFNSGKKIKRPRLLLAWCHLTLNFNLLKSYRAARCSEVYYAKFVQFSALLHSFKMGWRNLSGVCLFTVMEARWISRSIIVWLLNIPHLDKLDPSGRLVTSMYIMCRICRYTRVQPHLLIQTVSLRTYGN